MANKKISELNSASLPLAGTEVVPIVQGGETKKVSVSEFKEVIEGYFNGTNFYTDSEFTNLITPESGKIYINIAVTPATQYRWSGSAYVQISGGGKTFIKPFDLVKVNNGINGVVNYGSGAVSLLSSAYNNANSIVNGISFTDILSSTSTAGSFSTLNYLNYSSITDMPVSFSGYFGIGNTTLITDSRSFFGLVRNGFTINNINPSVAAQVAITNDSTEDNLQISFFFGSAITKIDLGSNFPARYTKGQHLYKIRISITSSTTATVTIKDLVTGNKRTENLTGLALTKNVVNTFSMSLNSNTTAVATRLLFNHLIVEDDYEF